jgi:hypothetical protein
MPRCIAFQNELAYKAFNQIPRQAHIVNKPDQRLKIQCISADAHCKAIVELKRSSILADCGTACNCIIWQIMFISDSLAF